LNYWFLPNSILLFAGFAKGNVTAKKEEMNGLGRKAQWGNRETM
jgi:hypothetical protein